MIPTLRVSVVTSSDFYRPGASSFRRLLSTTTRRQRRTKPRVVILGSGWGGNTLARRLDKRIYDVRLISPANHFLFTPLLPSTAVGTLEFRAVQEPVRTIKGLGEYYQAKARDLDLEKKTVRCEDVFKGHTFDVEYDHLVVAAGNKTNTFNTPGVAEHENKQVFFLKHLFHARQIRNRVLECFERASNPNISDEERQRLLSFVVVGGGPTSCEFASELFEFLEQDVATWFPDLKADIKVTLVEAGPGILGSFDKSLSEYYLETLKRKNIDVRLNTAVKAVEDRFYEGEDGHHHTVAVLGDGSELPFGTMVWSAGLAPVKFVERSGLPLVRGRIPVDEYLRVPGFRGRVFALGDCSVTDPSLPPTASVAEQQATYLGDCLNEHYNGFDVLDETNDDVDLPLPGPVAPALMPLPSMEFLNRILCKPAPQFQYKVRGAMAVAGSDAGVADLTDTDLPLPHVATSGKAAFWLWRSTYLTKQLSLTNMMLVPMYWFKQKVFGRDISRF